ncbi:unnamed protein product [Notodromas monacha]|uniref:Uncharacterized protein n=1 Tax=Notodromas monacha TaxID=399045 RepID=A0A7R9BKK9_9CRUS|nr:unnamed protein product [Notodromas monacha]CAG0915867.1 unnamed protein product [Notodromas monacha]
MLWNEEKHTTEISAEETASKMLEDIPSIKELQMLLEEHYSLPEQETSKSVENERKPESFRSTEVSQTISTNHNLQLPELLQELGILWNEEKRTTEISAQETASKMLEDIPSIKELKMLLEENYSLPEQETSTSVENERKPESFGSTEVSRSISTNHTPQLPELLQELRMLWNEERHTTEISAQETASKMLEDIPSIKELQMLLEENYSLPVQETSIPANDDGISEVPAATQKFSTMQFVSRRESSNKETSGYSIEKEGVTPFNRFVAAPVTQVPSEAYTIPQEPILNFSSSEANDLTSETPTEQRNRTSSQETDAITVLTERATLAFHSGGSTAWGIETAANVAPRVNFLDQTEEVKMNQQEPTTLSAIENMEKIHDTLDEILELLGDYDY